MAAPSFPGKVRTAYPTGLSGGERQRIVVARALLRQPRILILDEGTAALDAVTERDLLDGLLAERGMTIVMIAHKLSNIVRADQIIVMDAGRVAGVGQHAELIDNHPVYKRLWERQQSVGGDSEHK